MARDREERRRRDTRLKSEEIRALRMRYYEQLPTIAAILAAETPAEDAVDEALDLIEASLEAIEEETTN